MSPTDYRFTVRADEERYRLDAFLKARMSRYSRSQIQKWIKQGAILHNGLKTEPSRILKEGDLVEGFVPREEISVIPEEISLNVVYEDREILVVNKPAGMVTHPAKGNFRGTLVNALVHYLAVGSGRKKLRKLPPAKGKSSVPGVMRPGIVHRLDKETSGLLVVAKNRESMENLSGQFEKRTVSKIYLALVGGRIRTQRGQIEGSIGKESGSFRMAVVPTGRFARTDFKVIRTFSQYTYLEVRPHTGRTHQIRVHLAKIGHPVAGDKIYSSEKQTFPRQMLHAHKLTIDHPRTKKKMTFSAPIPKDFSENLKSLGHNFKI